MRVYHFSEQPYADLFEIGLDSLRNSVPSRYCDPAVANEIYHRRLDEYQLCDELGIDIMLNEHHATATCLSVAPTLSLAILARVTKNARLLALGVPLANKTDLLRVAEEMAMIDVLSRGRLEMGFVKGAPYEISANNSNPAKMMDRFWEAHDFVLEAMSSRDGPINFEGKYIHHRQANVWPQPWQQPHPPVWMTAGSVESTRQIAARGHILAAFLCGWSFKKLTAAYRQVAEELGRPPPNVDRFAYLAQIAVAETEKEAFRLAYDIEGYNRSGKFVSEAFVNPPGYMTAQANAKWLARDQRRGTQENHSPVQTKDGRIVDRTNASTRDLIDAGASFAGTPDQVFEQICEFCDAVGGVGHLIGMFHGGSLSHEDTKANLKLFASEVLPRLHKRYGKPSAAPQPEPGAKKKPRVQKSLAAETAE